MMVPSLATGGRPTPDGGRVEQGLPPADEAVPEGRTDLASWQWHLIERST
jgi:hypothetical protein